MNSNEMATFSNNEPLNKLLKKMSERASYGYDMYSVSDGCSADYTAYRYLINGGGLSSLQSLGFKTQIHTNTGKFGKNITIEIFW